MAIKTSFSIKDLENLSGVKAHTIRIWEKRYSILEPERTDSNIRTYNVANLQKLLNVVTLNNNGFKISKISKFTETELRDKVKNVTVENNENKVALVDFKLAMLNFDQELFERTYHKLSEEKSFRDIFLNDFMWLLEDIGNLWSTSTITPMHERFISTLIKQKVLVNIEKVQSLRKSNSKVFALFLPLNELHDIGLLYLHFELILKGYNSVFLGAGIPIENLQELQKVHDEITYVSYFTIEPKVDSVEAYLVDFQDKVLSVKGEELHLFGKNALSVSDNLLPEGVKVHKRLLELINVL